VNNCKEYIELISAYTDGELSDADIQSVEEHIAICENCSAFMKICREINISTEESSIPAPEALRISVMNSIKARGRFFCFFLAATKKQKNRPRRADYPLAFTRYAPIAASLVAVLLIWQLWGNNIIWNISGNDAMPAADPAAGAPMYDMTESVADAPMADADSGYNEFIEPECDNDNDLEGESTSGGANNNFSSSDDVYDDAGIVLAPEGNGFRRHEVNENQSYFNNAYAIISIFGEMPELRTGYKPVTIEPWYLWSDSEAAFGVPRSELVFEIPRSELDALLAELRDNDEAAITYNNNESEYIIILFTEK
jgi:hypothetical protein